MAAVLVTSWAIASASLALSLATLPRWFSRSMHRHRMWRHRDAIVQDILADRLPDHPAVWELLNDAERDVRVASGITLLRCITASRSVERLSPEARRRYAERTQRTSLDDRALTAPVRNRIESHRNHQQLLLTELVMLGSWLGVFTVLAYAIGHLPKIAADGWRYIAAVIDKAARESLVGRTAAKSSMAGVQMDRWSLAGK